jgi:hypothetical protein
MPLMLRFFEQIKQDGENRTHTVKLGHVSGLENLTAAAF